MDQSYSELLPMVGSPAPLLESLGITALEIFFLGCSCEELCRVAVSSQASCPIIPKGTLEKTAGWA